jgi:hypothetical protein
MYLIYLNHSEHVSRQLSDKSDTSVSLIMICEGWNFSRRQESTKFLISVCQPNVEEVGGRRESQISTHIFHDIQPAERRRGRGADHVFWPQIAQIKRIFSLALVIDICEIRKICGQKK